METILPESRKSLLTFLESGQNLGYTRTKNEVKADLLRKLPHEYISWKPVGRNKQTVPYISWTDCLLIMDYVCPNYDYQIEENQVGNQIIVKGKITVHCVDGDIKVEALGTEDLNDTAFGGAVMDASAQAMRRACATLGLGRYLYTDPGYHQQQKPQPFSPRQASSSPPNSPSFQKTDFSQQKNNLAEKDQEKIRLIEKNSNLLKSLYGNDWETKGREILLAKFRKKTRYELSCAQVIYFNKLLTELISSPPPFSSVASKKEHINLKRGFS